MDDTGVFASCFDVDTEATRVSAKLAFGTSDQNDLEVSLKERGKDTYICVHASGKIGGAVS